MRSGTYKRNYTIKLELMETNFTKNVKKALLLGAALFTAGVTSAATITIKDADLTNGTHNWTNDNVYMLDGFVFLETGGVLNIEAGTVIKGVATPTTSDNASALIITVGAQINAMGTAAQPIIFTSEVDDVTVSNDVIATDRGLWGGLIILGDGVLGNSTATSNIEGIPTNEPRAVFGGSNNANNAGTLKYVSIRHGGAELSPGDEINGLTLGGVGSGTTIEHVEVLSNSDDGIEFFGGAVSIKWATVAFCGDDAYDWDLGWVGNGQFWFVLQDPADADNGGEWDGAKPDGNVVFSNPTVYNATFIGSGSTGATANNANAILMRDATAGKVGNSIFTEYANKALEVEDLSSGSGVDSYQRMLDGDLELKNNIWYDFGGGTTLDADPTTGIIRFTSGGDDTTCASLISHLTTNGNALTDPMLTSVSRLPNAQLDPRPSASGPATTGLAATPSDPWFSDVDFKGAFDVFGTECWLTGWTALDEYGYLATITSVEENEANVFDLNVYPNPVTDNVNFAFNANEDVNITIIDTYGKVVAEMNNVQNLVQFNTNNIAAGVYLVRINSATASYTERFIVR